LIQAVRRNHDRFPVDFMFQLTLQEWENLKSQSVISSWGGIRIPPYAFPSAQNSHEPSRALCSSCNCLEIRDRLALI
jgi:hypothetical protein